MRRLHQSTICRSEHWLDALNFGNMFSVLGASIFLPFLPMTAIQVPTNNLLYDFS
jgi:hypothetical protein